MKNSFFRVLPLLITLLVCGVNVNAQKITKSPIYTEHKWYRPNIVGEDDKYVYVYAASKKDYKLECYDKNTMKEKYKVSIGEEEAVSKKIDAEVARIVFAKDRFIVFYEYYEKMGKKDKHYKLYAKSFKSSTGKAIGGKKMLLDISIEKKRRKGNFYVLNSEDDSKIFIEHSAYYKKLKKTLKKYILLDNELNVLHEEDQQNAELPYYYVLDNDGSLFYATYNTDNQKLAIASLDANKEYEKWEERLDLDIKAPYIQLNSMSFDINKNNELVCTGLYSTSKAKPKKGGVLSAKKKIKTKLTPATLTGCFYVSLDHESKEIRVNEVNPFTKKFLDQFKTKKQLKKGKDKAIGNSYSRLQTIDLDNGGSIVIGEKYQHEIWSNDKSYGETIIYGDMIIMNFDNEGKLIWSQRVAKNQLFYYSANGYLVFSSRGMRLLLPPTPYHTTKYFSYYAGIENGKLVVRYNDRAKNLTKKNDIHEKQKAFKKPNKAVIHKYEIDLTTGEYKSILDTKFLDPSISLLPETSYQKDNKSDAYIFAQKGKKYQFIKVSPKK